MTCYWANPAARELDEKIVTFEDMVFDRPALQQLPLGYYENGTTASEAVGFAPISSHPQRSGQNKRLETKYWNP